MKVLGEGLNLKAGVYKGPEMIEFDNIDKPINSSGEALIKIKYAGFCGSDLFIYSGKHPRAKPPLVPGHEFSGIVEEIKGESNIQPGDRVTVRPTYFCNDCPACIKGFYHVCENLKLVGIDCDGGFGEYAAVSLDQVFKLPDKLGLKEASLIEPLAVAVHSVRSSSLKVGDDAVILGSGPIGILLAIVAKKAGANEVYINDINEFRLEIARQFGFKVFNSKKVNPVSYINEVTSGKGADVLFEAAGVEDTAKIMSKMTKIKGEIVVVSVFKKMPETDLLNLNFKEQSMIGTRVYTDKDFDTAIKTAPMIENLGKIITDELKLEEVEEGIKQIKRGDKCLKVVCKME